jgi:hypothetical protein
MAARLVHVLGETTGKPVCEGGLAHYFVSEAHRRSDMIQRLQMPRRAPSPSAICGIISLPASHREPGRMLPGECPVCMEESCGDSITLLCGHSFHRRCIVPWLQVKSSCPCCRAPVSCQEPYRYPARTKLRNPWLRDRTERRNDMRAVAQLAQLDGMTMAAQMVLMDPATPLTPVLSDSFHHQGCDNAAGKARSPAPAEHDVPRPDHFLGSGVASPATVHRWCDRGVDGPGAGDDGPPAAGEGGTCCLCTSCRAS